MFNQHAKWLKTSRTVEWRRPIASLNYLLTSHVWRQDHNGSSHQDPGFMDHVANKKADTVRIYLPPDANTLLWVTDHCLRSWHRINVIVAGKQPEPQWLDMESAIKHCSRGLGHLGMGQQRPWRRARGGDGLCGRRADAGMSSGRRPSASLHPRSDGAGRQRRRHHDVGAEHAASPRPSPMRISTRCSLRTNP